MRRPAWALLATTFLSVCAVGACGPRDDSAETVCFAIKRDGKDVPLGVPANLLPQSDRKKGGNAFLLNLGVDLKDFSPASSMPNVDDNLDFPDWSVEKYGYNPDLDLFSVRLDPEYLADAKQGNLVELKSDVQGFRRYEACQDCDIDVYLPEQASSILLMRCYVPSTVSDRKTGCMTDEVYGSAMLRYDIPYIVRQNPKEIESRVVALMEYFEKLGAEHCNPAH